MSGTGFRLRTEPIGGSSLAQAAQRGDARAGWYTPRPAGRDEWTARCRGIAQEFSGVDWLGALAPALDAHDAAAERLAQAASGAGVVVTTGQQPGLFGGPVYTWSKAIGVLGMADTLQERTGVPVAPVFWAATDDADFEEASHTTIAIRGGARDLALSNAPAPGTPMAAAPLGPVDEEMAALAEACGSAAYAGALDAARDAYAAGATIGSAYVTLLRRLLEPLGIAVLDASHDAVRRAARPAIERALGSGAAIDQALARRDTELAAAGHRPQVERVPGLTLVFAIESGIKRRLKVGERPAAGTPLSPNVLLRPVVERSILPTVGYLAGPGELAYFAQVSAVADAGTFAQPLALPRWSVTIIEDHVSRIMRRLDVTESELRDPHATAGRLARAAMPASVGEGIASIREAIARSIERIADDPEAEALLPRPALDGISRSLEHRLERIERRFLAAVKREEAQLMTDLRTIRGYLHPHESRQERVLNFLPFLSRQGRPLLDAMLEEARKHADALITGVPAREAREAAIS